MEFYRSLNQKEQIAESRVGPHIQKKVAQDLVHFDIRYNNIGVQQIFAVVCRGEHVWDTPAVGRVLMFATLSREK